MFSIFPKLGKQSVFFFLETDEIHEVANHLQQLIDFPKIVLYKRALNIKDINIGLILI